jgi:hypothetical protein
MIGSIINKDTIPGCEILKDSACGGEERVTLFCRKMKHDETEYCEVDILISKGNEIRVIIEIEESEDDPNHIFGKFLSSALSMCYIHGDKTWTIIEKGDRIAFIQIMSTDGLDSPTIKKEQWRNIEQSIRTILPLGNINRYYLFYGMKDDFENNKNHLKDDLIETITHASL